MTLGGDQELQAKLVGLAKQARASSVASVTKDLTCLRLAPQGCSALTDRFSCLSSKNATRDACLWCGGPCQPGGSPCESSRTVLVQAGRRHGELCWKAPLVLSLETPSCVDGAAEVFAKPSLQRPTEAGTGLQPLV